ncbi:hypothetical protein ACIBJE_24605 [Micromonospora sp. NPDC050187]|uniref:hypothetical protein n=1 Tax=Micromonospora sp. NPDC050187 TaxID=3364277 RepID=UPI0037AE8EFB
MTTRPLRPASLYHLHRPLMAFSAAMAVMTVAGVVGLVVDDRTLVGAPIWAKPFKFALSFLLYAPTLAWLLSLLRRHHTAGRRAGTVVAVTAAVEMVIIVGQVLRGRQSHYNVLTAFDATLWTIMGVSIGVLWAANLVVAVLLLRERIADRATSSAIRLGLALAVAGMALGFLMTGPTPEQATTMREGVATVVGAHSVGVPDGGPGLPLIGWSTTGGDLRIPHFVGMHGLQVLPLVGLALLRLGRRLPRLRDDGTRRNLVRTVAAGYAGLVALVTWQALRGQPLTAPDAATLGAAAVLLVLTVGSAAAVLATARTPVPTATPALVGGTR